MGMGERVRASDRVNGEIGEGRLRGGEGEFKILYSAVLMPTHLCTYVFTGQCFIG